MVLTERAVIGADPLDLGASLPEAVSSCHRRDCGGSDELSSITGNPALGVVSDLIVVTS